MLWRWGVLALAGAVLVACAQEVPPEEQKVFGRTDCQRSAGNPAIEQEFERAKTVCMNRAQAAAVSGTTAMPYRPGLGGAIVAGIEQGMAQNQIGGATVMGCMAEHGYLLRTRTEHLSVCEAITAQRAVPATPSRRR
jgi:hypothetical protein